MQHATIYVDYDDVLCETALGMTTLLRQMLGKTVAFEAIHSFDLKRSFDLSGADYAAFMDTVHTDAFLDSLQPLPGAAETLAEWQAKGHTIVIVTGRPPATDAASRRWLAAHNIPYASLIFVDKYSRSHPPIPGATCLAMDELLVMPFDLVVEDSPDMVTLLLNRHTARIALLDRPWNRRHLNSKPSDRLQRVRSWRNLQRYRSTVIPK